jgi:hypothetical protein
LGLAEQLLLHPELPPIIRARCHIVLGTGNSDYLAHTEEAVRILNEMNDDFYGFPQDQMQQAKKILKKP